MTRSLRCEQSGPLEEDDDPLAKSKSLMSLSMRLIMRRIAAY